MTVRPWERVGVVARAFTRVRNAWSLAGRGGRHFRAVACVLGLASDMATQACGGNPDAVRATGGSGVGGGVSGGAPATAGGRAGSAAGALGPSGAIAGMATPDGGGVEGVGGRGQAAADAGKGGALTAGQSVAAGGAAGRMVAIGGSGVGGLTGGAPITGGGSVGVGPGGAAGKAAGSGGVTGGHGAETGILLGGAANMGGGVGGGASGGAGVGQGGASGNGGVQAGRDGGAAGSGGSTGGGPGTGGQATGGQETGGLGGGGQGTGGQCTCPPWNACQNGVCTPITYAGSTVDGGGRFSLPGGSMVWQQIAIYPSGTVVGFGVRAGPGDIAVALYASDTSGTPTELLATTGSFTSIDGENQVTVPPLPVSNGNYFLAVASAGGIAIAGSALATKSTWACTGCYAGTFPELASGISGSTEILLYLYAATTTP
jgi:hypothetical protein